MSPEPSSRSLKARLPASVDATLMRAAELKGRCLTDFLLSAAMKPPSARSSRKARPICPFRIRGVLPKPSSVHRHRTPP